MADPEKTAETEEQQDINERVRGFLKGMLRNILILGLFALLGWVVYNTVLGTGDPRRELDSPEATLIAYTQFVQPYIGPSGARPSITQLSDFLSFFDQRSRDFFEENYGPIARLRYQFDEQSFNALSEDEKRVEAMRYAINLPPLSGIGSIVEQRTAPDGPILVIVTTRQNTETLMKLEERGGLYYIQEFGGLRNQLMDFSAPYRSEPQ